MLEVDKVEVAVKKLNQELQTALETLNETVKYHTAIPAVKVFVILPPTISRTKSSKYESVSASIHAHFERMVRASE